MSGEPCPNEASCYRLRSAGLIAGVSPAAARLRSSLYASFLVGQLA